MADTRALAASIRRQTLRMVHHANASHVGTCLSMADILAVLYGAVLRYRAEEPQWRDRDRLILSKGHGAAALYAVLAACGFFPAQWLDHYADDGSPLLGHASHHVPGVEFSTGSLGHGLPVGCGIALAGKRAQQDYYTYVLLSDGEMDEGSVWEALLFAPQHRLDRLVAIIDHNKIQSFGTVEEVLSLAPLGDKLRAFRWDVVEVDGHDHDALRAAMVGLPRHAGQPTAVIAHTVKGKGVSFMEHQLAWHYKSPNSEQLAAALGELSEV